MNPITFFSLRECDFDNISCELSWSCCDVLGHPLTLEEHAREHARGARHSGALCGPCLAPPRLECGYPVLGGDARGG